MIIHYGGETCISIFSSFLHISASNFVPRKLFPPHLFFFFTQPKGRYCVSITDLVVSGPDDSRVFGKRFSYQILKIVFVQSNGHD